MVSKSNLEVVVKWTGVTKRLVEKRTMTFMEIMDTMRGLVENDKRFIFYMTTRHDGASIYFFDAEQPRYEYSITIYPEYEVLLELKDTDNNQIVSSLEL